VRLTLARIDELPVVAAVRRAWRDPRFGPLLQLVTGYVALFVAIEFFLRHHRPPQGIFVLGIIVGLLYAMIGFGLILIYRANRIINFAQAEMGAVSAVMGAVLIKVHHIPWLLGFAIAIASAVVGGFLVEVLIVRRFAHAPRLILSVATIGVALIFGALQIYLPGWLGSKNLLDPSAPKTPFSSFHFHIDPLTFSGDAVAIFVAAGLVVVGLTAFFRFTDVGIAVRASAENADRAALLGIPVKRVSTIVWMIAAALSALAVFLRIPIVGVPIATSDIGPVILIYGLAAAVIGRMESFSRTLFAGIAIGIIQQSFNFFSRNTVVADAFMLPVLLGAMLLQRHSISRGQDSGVATWSMAQEFRPIPPELRKVPEVEWGRFALGALIVGAAIVYPAVASLNRQVLAGQIVIYAIVVVSLVILTGWAGQISLGQWGLAGIGAGVAGSMAAHLHSDFFVTLVAAGVAGAVVAVIIGLPALRIQGLYLAVTTLAFAIAVQIYLLSPNFFRSQLPDRAHRIERPLLYGRIDLVNERNFVWLCLVFLVLALASARALRHSRTGRVLLAVRDNTRGAQSYGISVPRARLAAFAISGFWAAIAGGLFAYHQTAIDTAAYDPRVSLLLLVAAVIGGLTSLPGALLGTFYVAVIQYAGLSPALQEFLSAFGVLLLLLVAPGGLAQIFYGARDGVLRAIALRRGIRVPSLVADDLGEVERVDAGGEADALRAAAGRVGRGHRHGLVADNDVCPTCGERLVLPTAVTT
jgi:branched-chain amino acid transport system permease protein